MRFVYIIFSLKILKFSQNKHLVCVKVVARTFFYDFYYNIDVKFNLFMLFFVMRKMAESCKNSIVSNFHGTAWFVISLPKYYKYKSYLSIYAFASAYLTHKHFFKRLFNWTFFALLFKNLVLKGVLTS